MSSPPRTASRVIFLLLLLGMGMSLWSRRTRQNTELPPRRYQLTIQEPSPSGNAPPISDIATMLESADTATCQVAVNWVDKMSPEQARPLLPRLIALLKRVSTPETCRSHLLPQLASILARFGAQAKPALPYLFAGISLREPSCSIALDQVVAGVLALDPTSPRLGSLLVDNLIMDENQATQPFDEGRREWLILSLSKIKTGRKALGERLVDFIEARPGSPLVPYAVEGLHALGVPEQALAPIMQVEISGGSDFGRSITCRAVTRFRNPLWAVGPLQQALMSWPARDSRSFGPCLNALFTLSPACPSGSTILTKALMAREDYAPLAALEVLWSLAVNEHIKMSSLLPLVARELARPGNRFVHFQAANTLGGFASDASAYLPTLLQIVRAEPSDESLIAVAQSAIKEIAPNNTDLLPLLVSRMKHGPLNVRNRVTFELVGWGPRAVDALPALMDQLHERNLPLGLLAYTSSAILAIDPSSEHIGEVKRGLAEAKAKTAQSWEEAAYDKAVHELDFREVAVGNE